MESDSSILVLGSASAEMSTLAERIPQLGYRCARAKTPQDAIDLVNDRNFSYAAALVDPSLPCLDLGQALASIRSQSGNHALEFIATGSPPDDETRARLREAGIRHAAWWPVNDQTLRFLLNSALYASREIALRADTRAPVEGRAQVHVGGRTKLVDLYSLAVGGAFFETGRPSMPGARVRITIPTPNGRVEMEGEVLYTNVPGNLSKSRLPMGMAVRFEGLDKSKTAILREYVDKSAAHTSV